MSNLHRSIPEAAKLLRSTPIMDDDFLERRDRLDTLLHEHDQLPELPSVVCLCGSTRFYDVFQLANYELTLAGKIVLSMGFYPARLSHTWARRGRGPRFRAEDQADALHKRKIDLADEVLILNVDDYVGDSTSGELAYARLHNKRIWWLEPSKLQLPEELTYDDLLSM